MAHSSARTRQFGLIVPSKTANFGPYARPSGALGYLARRRSYALPVSGIVISAALPPDAVVSVLTTRSTAKRGR